MKINLEYSKNKVVYVLKDIMKINCMSVKGVIIHVVDVIIITNINALNAQALE